ncbi:MAG: hypothetical protein NTZ97_03440 [Candidatus Moranbacteria bacterium]|nr:hypothetical protein [Candidatus Moranbacteria bacterium]
MQEKKIIIFIAVLFILSSVFLFFISDRYLNSEAQKDWWSAYFVNAKDASLNFVIENHSQNNNFHWEVSKDNNKLNEGDVNISKGDMKSIDLNNINATGKIIIDVSDGTDKKEIYKNF